MTPRVAPTLNRVNSDDVFFDTIEFGRATGTKTGVWSFVILLVTYDKITKA
jgi:hypothetical protein